MPSRCSVCNAVLAGPFLEDYWGNRYCCGHESQFPPCPFCYRLMTNENRGTHEEEVRCCRVCRATAVVSLEEAGLELARARNWVNRQGVTIRDPNLAFKLASKRELDWILGGAGHAFGMTRAVVWAGRKPEITITILRGLPRTLCAGSCVHELGHAWLWLHDAGALPPIDQEGLCELLAWRYYRSLPTPEGQYHSKRIAESPDPVYGAGFRKVCELVERRGFSQVINSLAYHKSMPS